MKIFRKPKCFVCGKEIGFLSGWVCRVDKYLDKSFVEKANKHKIGLWADVYVCKDCKK